MLHVIDTQLAARGVRPGQTVILDSARAEFTVVFALLLSLRGLRVVFQPGRRGARGGHCLRLGGGPRADAGAAARAADHHGRGLVRGAGRRSNRPITVDAAGPEGALVNRTSGSTGRPKFVLSTEGQQLDRLETRHSFFAARNGGSAGCDHDIAVQCLGPDGGLVGCSFWRAGVVMLTDESPRACWAMSTSIARDCVARDAGPSVADRDPAGLRRSFSPGCATSGSGGALPGPVR